MVDRAVNAVLGGIGERGALVAVVLFAALAGGALAAGVDDDADGRDAAHLELADCAANGRDAADDLMAGNERIDRLAPFVADHVQIGVADAAVENIDGDLAWSRARGG